MTEIKFYLTGEKSKGMEEYVTQQHIDIIFEKLLSKGLSRISIPDELKFLSETNLLIPFNDKVASFKITTKTIISQFYSLVKEGELKHIDINLEKILRSDIYGKLSSNWDSEDTIWKNKLLIKHRDNYYANSKFNLSFELHKEKK